RQRSPASCPAQHDGSHLELDSFPTRRSSDLTRSSVGRPNRVGLTAGTHRARPAVLSRQTYSSPVDVSSQRDPTLNPSARSSPCRSEEHTSELQSRENLVCRLLLEKKKKRLNR